MSNIQPEYSNADHGKIFSLNIVMQTTVKGMATDSLPENKENLCRNRK